LRRWAIPLLVIGLGVGCNLIVSLDELDSGKCPDGQKLCNKRCVSLDDATTGCAARDSCAPCVLPNARAKCGTSGDAAGKCIVEICNGNFKDCDDDGDVVNGNGCETDIYHSPDNCNGCRSMGEARDCQTANGFPGCSAGQCATRACLPGWGDCDGDPGNGCETDVTSSPRHCGFCENGCDSGACVDSRCM
jgi:hypothetical protein